MSNTTTTPTEDALTDERTREIAAALENRRVGQTIRVTADRLDKYLAVQLTQVRLFHPEDNGGIYVLVGDADDREVEIQVNYRDLPIENHPTDGPRTPTTRMAVETHDEVGRRTGWDSQGPVTDVEFQRTHVPVMDLERTIDQWEDTAEYARENGVISEYDGTMACVSEVRTLIQGSTDHLLGENR